MDSVGAGARMHARAVRGGAAPCVLDSSRARCLGLWSARSQRGGRGMAMGPSKAMPDALVDIR